MAKTNENTLHWLRRVGIQDSDGSNIREYKEGQLIRATEVLDSIYDYDRWQHLQIMMGKEVSLEDALLFIGILYENDIEIHELHNSRSDQFYKSLDCEMEKLDSFGKK